MSIKREWIIQECYLKRLYKKNQKSNKKIKKGGKILYG